MLYYLLSFVALPQLVGEEAEFAECQEIPLIVDGLLVVDSTVRFDIGRRQRGCSRRCGLPLLLFTLSSAVDHLEDLRLRRVDAGLVEERLEPLGFTDDAALLTAAGMDCGHAAPYLVQLSE